MAMSWILKSLMNIRMDSMKGQIFGCLPVLLKKGPQKWGKTFVSLPQSDSPSAQRCWKIDGKVQEGVEEYWKVTPWSYSHLRSSAVDWARAGINRGALMEYRMKVFIGMDLAFTFIKKWQEALRSTHNIVKGKCKETLQSSKRREMKEFPVYGPLSSALMGNRWEKSGNSVRLYFFRLQNHCRWWLQPWN